MYDKPARPASEKSPLRLHRETLKNLEVRSGVRTGQAATTAPTKELGCTTPTNPGPYGSCIRITQVCARD